MKEYLFKAQNRMRRWMIGRYGMDELSVFLCRVAFVVMLISCVPKLNVMSILSWTLLCISLYRCCSKKITARSRERDIYLFKASQVRSRLSVYVRMWRERRSHKYFRCKNCRSFVRVPRGKGRIEITCTKCRQKMTRKS